MNFCLKRRKYKKTKLMEIVKYIVFTKFLNSCSCKIFVAFFVPYEPYSFLLIVKETIVEQNN